MKKIYSILISFLLVVGFFSTVAYAYSGSRDTINLSDYSLDELIELHEEVRNELADRLHLNDDTLIGRSEYIVGKDIKPGIYTFTVAESDIEDGEIDNLIFVQDLSTSKYPSTSYDVPVGERVVLSLEEGQKLIIQGCACYVSINNPIWAP